MNDSIFGAACELIEKKSAGGGIIVAIDGRCASGKTTLASRLASHFNANVFHTDDFFPRPEQRSEERLATPGSNSDSERILAELIIPLASGKAVIYRPYDCKKAAFTPAVTVENRRVNIIEGAYSCHPLLFSFYGARIFMTVSREEQFRRILIRNGKDADVFVKKWIPLEERYFDAFATEEKCDITLCTD